MVKVIFCLPGRTFSNHFLNSWSSLLSNCGQFNVTPFLRLAYSNNIYIVRNSCLEANKDGPENQKPFQGKVNYDYIMWIDSDNIFTSEQFKTLLNTMEQNKNIHILAGIYLGEDQNRFMTHYLPEDKLFKKFKSEFIEPKHLKSLPKKPFPVLFTGMGFMLVRYGVTEALKYPWFEPRTIEYRSGERIIVGDDASFCVKAKEAGYQTFVDPRIIVGHEKSVILR